VFVTGELDLTKLRAFVTLAEYLHFGRAAEALHLTQPGLSRQIQTLERQLGARLLERDRRNVALTEAGRQLLEDALPLLETVNATRQRVARAARGPRRLVVGFRAGVIPTPAIAALCELHPDLVVDVKRLEWDDQEPNLLSGQVDIAYVREPITERGLRLIPLYHERRLAPPPGHDTRGARPRRPPHKRESRGSAERQASIPGDCPAAGALPPGPGGSRYRRALLR
jgi:DNA-binding transcriptional LysR family regulator